MEEIGIVKSLDGTRAKVMVSRKSSCCESCGKDSCDVPAQGIETEAINTIHAKVGQQVKIVMKPYSYMKGALLIYIIPVIALIAGVMAGNVYLPHIIISANLIASYSSIFSSTSSGRPGFPRGLNCRQQQRHQNADDCDHNEQFDQRKTAR